MTPHKEPETMDEHLVLIYEIVSRIEEQLKAGAVIINNHETAIRDCVSKTFCTERHNALTKTVNWLLGILTTAIIAVIAALLKNK